ncbi:MAG: FAD-dependent oxidoreductase [Solirubrobacterales bacterium]|nr:FAD-dependent oxidoreductase [Solirubrobacterales bacterium]
MADVLGLGLEEPVNRHGAFPRLGDEQRARLRALGTVRNVEPGEVLFREGEQSYDFFVVESGAVTIVQGYGEENRVIAVHGQHRFLGELNLLTGGTVYLTAVVRDRGEVIQVPAGRVREVVAEDQELSNVILRAFLERRSILIDLGTGHRVVGSRFSQDSRRLREFLARNRVPHSWVDLEEDEEAEQVLRALGVAPAETPVVLLSGGGVLRNPSNSELSVSIGLGARGSPPAMCDLVIVGGGPAGLAAALYGASEGLDTQAVEAVAFGGQAGTSSRIENYLGFPAGISGSELADRAQIQAAKFGARLVVPAEATALRREDGHYAIELSNGQTIRGRTIIVATGARYRKLDVPNLERYEGLGVLYAATQAEAQLCFGDPVVIVGGGNSAGQAAMFLGEQAANCKLLIRGPSLERSMSRYLIDEIERRGKVEVLTHTSVVELRGEDGLEEVVVEDGRAGERQTLPAKALFVFIGASPHTDWLRSHVAMDEHGFLLTGRDVDTDELSGYDGEAPFFLETSLPGIFAVGDVRAGSVKRVASGVGEGSMSVRLVHQRLSVH